jgi:hypothetical protein
MTDDPALLIHAPLGQPGSGRVRYGAAMQLWQQGQISAEVLEAYRTSSPHDGRDPLAVLQAQGLPAPVLPPVTDDPVHRLYIAARDYLLTLDHPGAAEVRAGLPPNPGPLHPAPPRSNAVMDRWLMPALAALQGQPLLANAIGRAAPMLDWVTYDAYPRAEIGEGFATGHAFASILGDGPPFAACDFDMGLFLIAPHVLYRDHHHPAPELYAPLTGPHGWRFGPGRPLMVLPAHQPIWNPPHRPHLTKIGAQPFLSFFVWTKDTQHPAQVIPADDWPLLESTPLANDAT